MTTTFLRSIGVVVILVVTGCSVAQVRHQPPAQESAERNMTEQQLVRDSVQVFLSSWLIDRDADKAIRSFGEGALKNESMLQESCASYIKPEERGSEVARRAGIKKFLRDFLPGKAPRSLGDVLDRASLAPMTEQLGNKLVNDPNTDLFALAELTAGEVPTSNSEEAAYLKKHLPPKFYASFVPVGQGMVYFLWVPEGGQWRIFHASLVCM